MASVNVATLKLDGKRVALCCRNSQLTKVEALRTVCLGTLQGTEDFVLDTEEKNGEYWAFDALMVGGRDLRGLTLADRVLVMTRLVGGLSLPEACTIKAKPFVCLRSPECVSGIIRDSRRASYDGLIFSSLLEAYETPSLKFKQTLTIDFCLESLPGKPCTYQLLTQNRGKLKAFHENGKPCHLLLTLQERERLGVPEAVERTDSVIVECALPLRGHWKAVRRREDRERPNCLKTVLDTLATRRLKMDCEKTLLRSLPQVSTKDAFLLWRDILRRRLLWALEELDKEQPRLVRMTKGGSFVTLRADGFEDEELSPHRLCVGETLVFWSIFDSEEQVIAELLSKVRDFGKDPVYPGPLNIRVLVLFQSCAQRELLQNLSYFGLLLSCEADAVLKLARDASFENASLIPLEPRGPCKLLSLPPPLELLAPASFALSIEVRAGREIFSSTLEKLYESVSVA
jgi:hypothetical protein